LLSTFGRNSPRAQSDFDAVAGARVRASGLAQKADVPTLLTKQ
jgi:hypothetical protein